MNDYYLCDRCSHEFSQQAHYTNHLPCTGDETEAQDAPAKAPSKRAIAKSRDDLVDLLKELES